MTEPDIYAEARAMRDEQVKEWDQFTALVAIDINGARAANPGDPIPASLIADGTVLREQVVGTKTKTAAALTEKG